MRALLIQDDAGAAKRMGACLARDGITTDVAEVGDEAIELAKLYDYDVLVLDVSMPEGGGYEVLGRLRKSGVETPILVVSSSVSPEMRVRAFECGADDCVTKPFNEAELIARIRAIIRRSRGYSQAVIYTGRLAVNLSTKSVTVDGKRLNLTGKEYGILELLCLRKGATLGKETFLNHLYGGMDEPDGAIIDVFVSRLRRKIADATGDAHYIETIWGRGYALRDPVDVSDRMTA